MPDVMMDGIWLHSLGNVADVTWSTSWGEGPCGSALASCTLAIDPANDSTTVKLAHTFEVWSDGVKVFGGVLSELGRDFPRSLSAKGLGSRASDFDAVDGSGNPTTNPRTAVTAAIANGLPWTNPTAFPDITLGTEGGATVGRLDALLNQWATTAVKRWGVDVNGVAFIADDPTTPTWLLDASDLPLGVADDGLYTRVRARYVTTLDVDLNPIGWASFIVDDAAGVAEYGVIEYPMNLTDLGLISGTTATNYAQAQLDLLTVPQWLSRVTTNSSRLLTKGGLSAHLPSGAAGQMVRLFNVPNSLGGLRNELGLDVVLGEAQYDASSPTEITVAPIGLAVRNLADLAAQAKRAADDVAAKRSAA